VELIVCDPDPSDDAVIICGGAAKPTDLHLASTVHCVDDGGSSAGWSAASSGSSLDYDRATAFLAGSSR
jgi:hypothetical protein